MEQSEMISFVEEQVNKTLTLFKQYFDYADTDKDGKLTLKGMNVFEEQKLSVSYFSILNVLQRWKLMQKNKNLNGKMKQLYITFKTSFNCVIFMK